MERKKIALFIGNDISTYILINELIPKLILNGLKPYIYISMISSTLKKMTHPELKKQAYFERTLLNNTIYPFLEKKGIIDGAKCHSPKQLSKIYNITVQDVPDVNSKNFIAELKKEKIDIGIIIRSHQKFGKNIIDFFKKDNKNCLWNLHPGILPYYRGLMTYFRSMLDGQKKLVTRYTKWMKNGMQAP